MSKFSKIPHRIFLYIAITKILVVNFINPSLSQDPKDSEMDCFLDSLLSVMTLEEKVGQLNMFHWPWTATDDTFATVYKQMIREGKIGSFLGIYGVDKTYELQRIAVEESRLGIPLLFAFDVIHGWRTVFPVPLAESCSWDLELIEKTSHIAAIEASSAGIYWTFAPMVDIARDPRWGRIVEGSGEDPFLGEMIAAARVRGFQGKSLQEENAILACAKHFTAYGGAEGGRDYNTVDISERTLFEIYLPPFHAAVDAGVATIMGAFNEIGGIPMHGNEYLLNTILRKQWGFSGLVVSDWTAINELQFHGIAEDSLAAARIALTSGVDVDMVSGIYLNKLPLLIKEGKLSEDLINQAVRRMLKAKYQIGLFTNPYRYQNAERERTNILKPEHIELARKMARKSIVLLKNSNQQLPLKKNLKSLAIIGALAMDKNSHLGAWHGVGDTQNVVTILEGIKTAVSPGTKVFYTDGYDSNGVVTPEKLRTAKDIAKKSEAVIIVVGEPATMSGEAASRSDISLPGNQEVLIKTITRANRSVVMILMNGRPLALEGIIDKPSAVLEAWHLGIQMGNAVADVIFGDYNPGGKLSVTFPRHTGQIPIYYNHKRTGRPPSLSDKYTSKYIDRDWTPLFPFGYGLSYTTFTYNDMSVDKTFLKNGDSLHVSIRVTNNGNREGEEVVQLYIQDEIASFTRPVKELKGFKKLSLLPGKSQIVTFKITPEMLTMYNSQMKRIIEPGKFKVFVGGNSVETIEKSFEVTE